MPYCLFDNKCETVKKERKYEFKESDNEEERERESRV